MDALRRTIPERRGPAEGLASKAVLSRCRGRVRKGRRPCPPAIRTDRTTPAQGESAFRSQLLHRLDIEAPTRSDMQHPPSGIRLQLQRTQRIDPAATVLECQMGLTMPLGYHQAYPSRTPPDPLASAMRPFEEEFRAAAGAQRPTLKERWSRQSKGGRTEDGKALQLLEEPGSVCPDSHVQSTCAPHSIQLGGYGASCSTAPSTTVPSGFPPVPRRSPDCP